MEGDEVTQHIAALETRLAHLEAQLAARPASGASDAAALQENCVTTPFRVVTTEGQTLLEVTTLSVEKGEGFQEYPCLRLYGPERKLAAMLYVTPGGTAFTFTDAEGYEMLHVSAGAEGSSIRLRDGGVTVCRTVAPGQQQDTVRIGESGTARIELYNQENVAVSVLGVNAHGGTVCVSDHNQHPAALLAADSEGGSLVMTENSGQLRAWLSADAQGGHLELFNAAGEAVHTEP